MIFIYAKKKNIIRIIVLLFIISAGVILFKIDIAAVFYNNKKIPIYSVDTDTKKIAITFDISLGEDNTEKILKILKDNNVKATFFVVGVWVDKYPEVLKKICEEGHEIGNHTNKHPDMNQIKKINLIADIEAADEKIKSITGNTTELFRCPSGIYNNNILGTIKEINKVCIQWDVDSIDWRNDGEIIEYRRVISKVKPGSIILFHNTGKYTPDNLIKIINKLQSEGYKFVIVSDLIYKSNYFINNEGKQIRNKDIVN